MAELNKQDIVNDQYYISTTASLNGEGKYLSTVFGYRNKTIMWSKVYKQMYYNSLKEAEEGHKELKKQYS